MSRDPVPAAFMLAVWKMLIGEALSQVVGYVDRPEPPEITALWARTGRSTIPVSEGGHLLASGFELGCALGAVAPETAAAIITELTRLRVGVDNDAVDQRRDIAVAMLIDLVKT